MKLEKYIVPGKNKVNPNVRKLLKPLREEFLKYSESLIGLPVDLDVCTTQEMVRVFYHHINAVPIGKCKTCGKETKFTSLANGYNTYCSASCQMRDIDQQTLRAEDSLKRFGTKTYLHNPKGREKQNKTRKSTEFSNKLSASLKATWDSRREQITKKANATKERNKKPFWLKTHTNTIAKLKDQGYDIIQSLPSGKPLVIRHSCGQEQPYGRWSGEIYTCLACHPNPRIKKESAVLDEIEHLLDITFERNFKLEGIKVDGLFQNVAIDFNGLFWHSEAAEEAGFGTYDPNYHFKRYEICRRSGIKLIQIFEHDWKNKKDIVINRLMHILKKSNSIMARKCQVGNISVAEANAFLKKYHLSGHVPCSHAVGLHHNEKLVAVGTFGKTRFGKRDNYELLRFCSCTSIAGGLGKIVSHFSKHVASDIVSYSDNFWGSGEGYRSAGFVLNKQVAVGYSYYDKKNFDIVSRHAFRKDSFFKSFSVEWDSSLNEIENAKRVNCFRIGDAGKNRWLFKYG